MTEFDPSLPLDRWSLLRLARQLVLPRGTRHIAAISPVPSSAYAQGGRGTSPPASLIANVGVQTLAPALELVPAGQRVAEVDPLVAT
jgi:hypothetical protein